ncbi:MinD/ParA family protein [Nonomuraea sp. NBC_00507]|uniref:MinD/ParA family ATP-binding protein n=1 Tax=Nonomuraea sp. NBC_00507 TaxID=2976002 RepID=UPI002E19CD48
MPQVLTVHSYRGGTGKSSVAANLSVLLAKEGCRVAVLDADIHAPSLDTIFGINPGPGACSLVDYLVGECEIEDAVFPLEPPGLFAVVARTSVASINALTTSGYDVGLLSEGYLRLIGAFGLDLLILDTRTGLCPETVTAMASCDRLIVVSRADRLALVGASETMALTNRLGCSERALVVNMAPDGQIGEDFRRRLEDLHGCPIEAILPYEPLLAAHDGEGLFVTAHPNHPLVTGFRRIISAVIK